MGSQLFRIKSIDKLLADAENPEKRLKKTLGWLSLTALGIGAIIGTGIFVLTGTAAAGEEVRYPSIFKAPVPGVTTTERDRLRCSSSAFSNPAMSTVCPRSDAISCVRSIGNP